MWVKCQYCREAAIHVEANANVEPLLSAKRCDSILFVSAARLLVLWIAARPSESGIGALVRRLAKV